MGPASASAPSLHETWITWVVCYSGGHTRNVVVIWFAVLVFHSQSVLVIDTALAAHAIGTHAIAMDIGQFACDNINLLFVKDI